MCLCALNISTSALTVAQRHLVEQHMALAENLSVKYAAWGKQRGVNQQELQALAYQDIVVEEAVVIHN